MGAHRHFNMSALGATVAIRRYIAIHSDVDPVEAAISIPRLDADLATNDFDGGLEVLRLLPPEITFADPAAGLRATISRLIAAYCPWWTRGAPYGRDRVAGLLDADELQCFRAAGLLDDPAPDIVVQWWDELAQGVRAGIYDMLLQQGREAERLSLQHERNRMAALGIERAPRWIAIDDNGAGYDILSYDLGPVEPINRLIEVKSSTQTPPRINLTRGEWDKAVKFGEAYYFHIWSLPSQELAERTVEEMGEHIPVDRGNGTWSSVEIVVSGGSSHEPQFPPPLNDNALDSRGFITLSD